MNIDEQVLVEQAKNGDLAAFRKLVEMNKKQVYYLAYDLTRNREDAEDVSQEVFIKAYRSLDNFRGESKFSTWLYRITVNTSLNLKRKYSVVDMRSEEDMDTGYEAEINDSYSATYNPERMTESGFARKNIELALSKLSKLEKSVFVLRNQNELHFEEIQKILNLKAGTLRSLNFRAIKKLQKALHFYGNKVQSEEING